MNNLRTSPLSSCKNLLPLFFFMVHLLHRLYGVDAPAVSFSSKRSSRYVAACDALPLQLSLSVCVSLCLSEMTRTRCNQVGRSQTCRSNVKYDAMDMHGKGKVCHALWLVHQSLVGLAPAYLADDCRLLSDVGRRPLRSNSNDMRKLLVPRTHN